VSRDAEVPPKTGKNLENNVTVGGIPTAFPPQLSVLQGMPRPAYWLCYPVFLSNRTTSLKPSDTAAGDVKREPPLSFEEWLKKVSCNVLFVSILHPCMRSIRFISGVLGSMLTGLILKAMKWEALRSLKYLCGVRASATTRNGRMVCVFTKRKSTFLFSLLDEKLSLINSRIPRNANA